MALHPIIQVMVSLCMFIYMVMIQETLKIWLNESSWVWKKIPPWVKISTLLNDIMHNYRLFNGPFARYVILRVAHAPGMPGTFSPPPLVSDSGMHHGRGVAHVPWCMPGSLTSSRWRGIRSRHFRRMHNPHSHIDSYILRHRSFDHTCLQLVWSFHIRYFTQVYHDIVGFFGTLSLAVKKFHIILFKHDFRNHDMDFMNRCCTNKCHWFPISELDL